MEAKLFRQQYLYMAGLLLLVTGLPLSYFLTSVSQFFLAASFFLEGKVIDKWKRFFANRFAVLFSGIFILHVLGLLWTADLGEGWHDIRIKLPLLVLPIILAGTPPLDKKKFDLVILTFVASVFVASIVIFAVLTGVIHRPFRDIHEVFIFKISHVRFSLFICVSIFAIWIMAWRKAENSFLKLMAFILTIWFVFFMVKVESLTGLIVLIVVLLILGIRYVFSAGSVFGRVIVFLLIAIFSFGLVNYIREVSKELSLRHAFTYDLNEKTKQGNQYFFNLNDSSVENGYRIWSYICEPELRQAWNKRSGLYYDSLDYRNQQLRFTLIRYLTSKGLRKDAEAVQKLNDDEIISIENGIANVDYRNTSDLRARVKKVLWEVEKYSEGGNPSGHSVTQRFEFWKAAIAIISNHFWSGVGTGDLKAAYALEYERMETILDKEHRLHAHNQYMSIFAAFGIFGFVYFLFTLLYCWWKNKKSLFFSIFMIILLLSMITEDTLETQPGATFAAFFFCLLLFVTPENTRGSSEPQL